MGKYKDEHGISRVGNFLRKAAPEVLNIAADLTGVEALDKLSDAIRGTKALSPEQKQIALELLKLDYADVENARNMQIEALRQDDVFSKRFIYYFTGASVLLGFAYIFCITFIRIPENSQRFADTILGVVISIIFGTIYNFFFGSSKGSVDKQEIINRYREMK